MPTLAVERANLCAFTFASARRCRMPISPEHSYLCTFHARREADAQARQEAAEDVKFALSGRYISYCDLSTALAHCISAVVHRHLTPRAATSVAYLGQTLFQSLGRAEHEFINAFGADGWRRRVAGNFNAPRPGDDEEADTPADDTSNQNASQSEDHSSENNAPNGTASNPASDESSASRAPS
jgi:hypothetical protein